MENQKISIYIDTRRFLIKTAENSQKLEGALDLRYDVFYKESLNKDNFTKIDVDKFDLICDHLIIIDKKLDSIAGTYRLISSTFSDKFYSETEFLIDHTKTAKGIKVELGRACVHKNYRKGTVLSPCYGKGCQSI